MKTKKYKKIGKYVKIVYSGNATIPPIKRGRNVCVNESGTNYKKLGNCIEAYNHLYDIVLNASSKYDIKQMDYYTFTAKN